MKAHEKKQTQIRNHPDRADRRTAVIRYPADDDGWAAKLFTRLYRLWSAQLILDNTVQELRSITADASGYVKLYDTCGPDQTTADRTGEDSGAALEFGNADGYVVLVSAEGCPDTEICLGSVKIDETASADISPGSLLVRYYAREAENSTCAKMRRERQEPALCARHLQTLTTWGIIWK